MTTAKTKNVTIENEKQVWHNMYSLDLHLFYVYFEEILIFIAAPTIIRHTKQISISQRLGLQQDS